MLFDEKNYNITIKTGSRKIKTDKKCNTEKLKWKNTEFGKIYIYIFFYKWILLGEREKEREVVCGQVWWPILGICPLHLTHPSAHSQQWTHTWSSGQPYCGARGAVGGSVPCSRVSPQSWYWRWREHLLFTPPTYNPCRTWESNRQPLGYKSNSLTIRPRLHLHCIYTASLDDQFRFCDYIWFFLDDVLTFLLKVTRIRCVHFTLHLWWNKPKIAYDITNQFE